MSDREIKDLKEFLEACLKTTVLDYTLRDLTKPGENYGSIMQSLDVTVADANDRRKVLNLVSKSVMSNTYLVNLFQPSRTFVKEARFYSSIIPAIERFEVEANVDPKYRLDIFMKTIGSRVSLNPDSDVADADAVLILENAKLLNYVNSDRCAGFDSQASFVILSSLAQFHALCIALRRSKPEEFDAHIAPHVPTINLYVNDEDRQINKMVRRDLALVDGIDDEYHAKVLAQVIACDEFDRDMNVTEHTPYTTVVHRDFNINNVMLLKDENGKAEKIKIYDFQFYFYHSFVNDIIFFLMTSVRSDALERNFRIYINHYHEHFVKTLKRVNCPLGDYTIDKVWAEIRSKAKNELFHILFITTLLFKDEAEATPVDECTAETMSPPGESPEIVLERWKLILDLYRDNKFL